MNLEVINSNTDVKVRWRSSIGIISKDGFIRDDFRIGYESSITILFGIGVRMMPRKTPVFIG
jgi:hypothetical protein